MARISAKFTRRAVLGLLGTTALVRAAGLPTRAEAATGQPFVNPALMTRAPSLGPGNFAGEEWSAYTDSFANFVETWRENPVARKRPPLGLEPTDYTKVDAFYATSPKSREGITVTLEDDTASLWAPVYEDMVATPSATLAAVGPTMEFVRGEITGVWVKNDLEVCGPNKSIEPTAEDAGYTPHNFGYTNLHTHGLHVTPRAPSDDVLVTVVPDSIKDICTTHPDAITAKDPATFPYYYDIPANHPVGTFWYHPHMHGAVAAQVGAGMAGALLIRSAPGEVDLDEALATLCNITLDDERVIVIQRVTYSALESTLIGNQTVPAEPGQGIYIADAIYHGEPTDNLSCRPNELLGGPEFTFKANSSTTTTTVNGVQNPTVEMRPGEILRFRFVNASNGTNYIPKFSMNDGGPDGQALPQIYAIAVDGIPLFPVDPADDPDGAYDAGTPYFQIDYDQTRPEDGDTSFAARKYWTTAELITLAPAQRLDILVQAPDIGDAGEVSFTLAGVNQYDKPVVAPDKDGKGGFSGTPALDAPNVLDNFGTGHCSTDALVTVKVSGTARDDQQVPTMAFFDNAVLGDVIPGAVLQRPELPTEVQPVSMPVAETVDLWLSNYQLAVEEIAEPVLGVLHPSWKSLNFAYVQDPTPEQTKANFQINGQSFDANLDDDPQLTIPVNGWTSWELYSANDLHMFHIHINSFMMLGRYRVSEDVGPAAMTSFAPYLMPIWRDTAYFDAGDDNTAAVIQKEGLPNIQGRRIAALSYQIDFTGEFVFHCHSLYHEDNGMMYTVEIV